MFQSNLFEGWNGLALLNGTLNPENAFDPPTDGQELYSAGTAAVGTGMRRAVPEGVAIAETSTSKGVHQFLFVANYCGHDAAGFVLVQSIDDLGNVVATERLLIPYYEFLADYNAALPPSGFGPLGPEVDRDFYTCPMGTDDFPDCSDGIASVAGNKIRPVVAAKLDSRLAINGGKQFLFVGMNLDPIDVATYGSSPQPIDLGGRDDGKYDYIAISDITNMVKELPASPPAELWAYDDVAQWQSHTTFLRLPPDLAPGWSPGDAPPSGPFDWGRIAVPEPDPDVGQVAVNMVPIVGSGTPKAMAVSTALVGTMR